MGRTKAVKQPTNLKKTGHNLTSSAIELCRSLADLLKTDESILIETGIRLLYDKLPSSQREAISVILRAKGESLRSLRKYEGLKIDDGAGEGLDIEQTNNGIITQVSRIHVRSTAPVDAALEIMKPD